MGRAWGLEWRRTGSVSFEMSLYVSLFFCLSSTGEQHSSSGSREKPEWRCCKVLRREQRRRGKKKPKTKKWCIVLWRNGAKDRKDSGGGAVKMPHLPQKHSASVQLITAWNVKGAGFEISFHFVFFYHPF